MDTSSMRRARPYLIRAVVAALIALAGLVAASQFGQLRDERGPDGRDQATAAEVVVALSGAGVVALFGVVSVASFSTAVRKATEQHLDDRRGAPLSLLVRTVGYILVLLAILGALEVPLGGLLLGGAVTGVVIGIAAQQTLGNFFAGIVLLIVRPFAVGDSVVLRSGPLGGEYEGTVSEISLYYVNLMTAQGPVRLPNAGVLASAVGPGARAPKPPEEGVEDPSAV
jgi:small-conductance mechanosensitive channel